MAMNSKKYLDKLKDWTEASEQLAIWKAKEISLRNELFEEGFKDPEEGVNDLELPGGWVLKATHKINRTLDEASLPAALEKLAAHGGKPDLVVKWKPDLSVSEYRKLTEAQAQILEEAMTIKPGTPSLKLVPPKGAPK